jgi:uncharacterized membrane protein YhfC
LSFVTGLSAGAGHGAAESILIVGMLYVNNLIFSLAINNGTLDRLVQDDSAMAESIRTAILGTPPELFLMAGFERVFTMILQIFLTVLLASFLVKGRALVGFSLVLALHTAFDLAAGILPKLGVSALGIEAVILGIAGLSLAGIFGLRRRFGDRLAIPPDPAEEAVREGY